MRIHDFKILEVSKEVIVLEMAKFVMLGFLVFFIFGGTAMGQGGFNLSSHNPFGVYSQSKNLFLLTGGNKSEIPFDPPRLFDYDMHKQQCSGYEESFTKEGMQFCFTEIAVFDPDMAPGKFMEPYMVGTTSKWLGVLEANDDLSSENANLVNREIVANSSLENCRLDLATCQGTTTQTIPSTTTTGPLMTTFDTYSYAFAAMINEIPSAEAKPKERVPLSTKMEKLEHIVNKASENHDANWELTADEFDKHVARLMYTLAHNRILADSKKKSEKAIRYLWLEDEKVMEDVKWWSDRAAGESINTIANIVIGVLGVVLTATISLTLYSTATDNYDYYCAKELAIESKTFKNKGVATVSNKVGVSPVTGMGATALLIETQKKKHSQLRLVAISGFIATAAFAGLIVISTVKLITDENKDVLYEDFNSAETNPKGKVASSAMSIGSYIVSAIGFVAAFLSIYGWASQSSSGSKARNLLKMLTPEQVDFVMGSNTDGGSKRRQEAYPA